MDSPTVFVFKRSQASSLQQAARRIAKSITRSSRRQTLLMQTKAAAQASILQQILDAQRPLFGMVACEDSDSDCTAVSDDKLSVEEIHALQRRLNRGISHRNLRLQQLSHLLSERRRAEQASHQVSQDLQNQALLQAASAAEAEFRAQEAASLLKKDSLMRAVEDLASRNAGWDSEQRAENMKVAVAELAAMQEKKRLLSLRTRCDELEVELCQQKTVEAQLRESKRQRTVFVRDAVSPVYRFFCDARRDVVREELRSADSAVSTSKLARLVRQSLARQWECLSLEEQGTFFDGVTRQRNEVSTNRSFSLSADINTHCSAPSLLAASRVHSVSSVADNGCAVADLGIVS